MLQQCRQNLSGSENQGSREPHLGAWAGAEASPAFSPARPPPLKPTCGQGRKGVDEVPPSTPGRITAVIASRPSGLRKWARFPAGGGHSPEGIEGRPLFDRDDSVLLSRDLMRACRDERRSSTTSRRLGGATRCASGLRDASNAADAIPGRSQQTRYRWRGARAASRADEDVNDRLKTSASPGTRRSPAPHPNAHRGHFVHPFPRQPGPSPTLVHAERRKGRPPLPSS
jgi:hypothetical protein